MLKILEFPHSHFCEKARWALDAKGIPFERQSLFPGWHVLVVKKIARRSTVPVLLDGATVVQGSSEIISYLDQQYPARPLTPTGREAEILAFEKELDAGAGETIRRMLYHRLLADKGQVSYYFMHRSPPLQRAAFRLVYPIIAAKIRETYAIDQAGFVEATNVFERTLDRLDARLAHHPYLFGDTFSRADITAASLLCFLCMPAEHPVAWQPIKDPEVRTLLERHADRPTTHWVRRMYREHRRQA